MGYFDEQLDHISELRLRVDELRANRETIARMKTTIEQLETRNDGIVSRIAVLVGSADAEDFGTVSRSGIRFDDAGLSVSWNGGRLKFREDGRNAYRFFRVVFDSGEEGISHEEAAEMVFDDQCASLRRVIQSVRQKTENHEFPFELVNDGKFLKFLTP